MRQQKLFISGDERILFVEGDDDQHRIWAICERLQISETFVVEVPDGKEKISRRTQHHERGGIDSVFKASYPYLSAGSTIERIGVVIDADTNLEARWNRIKNILTAAGYIDLPDFPDPVGTIIKQEYLATFGVWIMPDNQLDGMLEDFLHFLVPDESEVWNKAVFSSQEVLHMGGETLQKIHLSEA